MPRVDFYILSDPTAPVLRFACRLCETIWSKGHQLHVHTQSEAQADELDRLLWTFRNISFVPHQKLSATMDALPPSTITLGWEDTDALVPAHNDVCLNLSLQIPEFITRFQRAAEIVSGDKPQRDAIRQHYRIYTQRGFESHETKI